MGAFHGALGIIKVNGQPIGKMKSISYSDNVSRGRVSGLGTLKPLELPALSWSGTVSVDSYLIEFSKTVFDNNDFSRAFGRNVQTVEDFLNTVLLQEQGVQVDILKKVKDTISSTGIITHKLVIFATIPGLFITSDGMDISEGTLSGRNAQFECLTPVIYPA